MTSFRMVSRFAIVALGAMLAAATSALAAAPFAEGQPAPAFTYHLLDGRRLTPGELRGHPYVLWMVASWCPSCQTGSNVVASHIDFLRSHGVRIVEMKLAKDLNAPGPGLQKFQKAVGSKASSSNWYWGELTDDQTVALDPKADMDMYYLVDARSKIVAISGNPAATWETIERFARSAVKTTSEGSKVFLGGEISESFAS